MKLIANYGYFRDILDQSLLALKDNKLRTVLSILGISIGIAAVMIVGAVSSGGRYVIFSELQTFGLKSIWVFRDNAEKDPRRATRSGSGIESQDYLDARSLVGTSIRYITPMVYSKGDKMLVRNGNRYSSGQIQGVGDDYLAINNDALSRGRYFREEDVLRKRAVAVIGSEVQNDLFPNGGDPIGMDVRISGKKFVVIGVLAVKSRDFLSSIGSGGGQNANNRILLPYTVFQQMLGSKEVNVLQGETFDLANTDAAVAQLKGMLKRRHGDHFNYKSETMAQYIKTAEKILQGVTLIGVVAASVSLFVGGMGIMNIMSTSVVERTREIGIRKALGARRREILLQFLLESMLISSIGGGLGLMVGLVGSTGLALATGFPLTPSWPMIVVALLVSIGVGLVSGYYPAYRAANLKPVEALRFE